ncbi:MAG: hypothetical protein KAJ22_02545 [Candidatus Izimaplasma sp.]|nr:hypothetical protein [Candidatus Izimaplasma bacterium]
MRKITIVIVSLLLVLTLSGCEEASELDLTQIENIVEEYCVENPTSELCVGEIEEEIIEEDIIEEDITEEELNIEEELELLADLTWGASAALSSDTLTIEQMLLYAIQDEYSAQAEYDYILTNFDVTSPFSSIIVAEGKHIDMILPLFYAYDIEVPENTAVDHVIEIESVYEAFETGVYAEIINIAMYNVFLEYDLPEDIETIFISLRDASMKHLNAFEKNLASLQ